jgi:TPR repeat protein
LVDVWERAAKPAIGSDPKFDEAFRTYLQGAKLGDAEAQIRIGDHYLHSSGGDHPEARAYFWYDLAAAHGSSAAAAKRDALKGALSAEDLRQVERWTREFNQPP